MPPPSSSIAMIRTKVRWLRPVLDPPSGKEARGGDGQRRRDVQQGLAGEEAHDGVRDEPDPAVDQEVQREGGPERGPIERAHVQVDRVEGAAGAEQRAEQPAEEAAVRGGDARAARRPDDSGRSW